MTLTIREEQFAVFVEAALRRFEARLRNYVRSELRSEYLTVSEDRLDAEICDALACARSFGFETENSLCRFLSLWLILGRNFHLRVENASMHDVLAPESDVDPELRMEWLYDGVIVRLRAAECGAQNAGT